MSLSSASKKGGGWISRGRMGDLGVPILLTPRWLVDRADVRPLLDRVFGRDESEDDDAMSPTCEVLI